MSFFQLLAALLLVATLSGCKYPALAEYLGLDLDCSDFSAPVWVGDHDPHDLDADGDGWGCESLA